MIEQVYITIHVQKECQISNDVEVEIICVNSYNAAKFMKLFVWVKETNLDLCI